jgi:hypothetical protein
MSDKPVRVEIAERCPGAPHPHDWVELAPDPTIATGAAITMAIRKVGNDPTLLVGEMARVYLNNQITAWSFVDDEGKPIPVAYNAMDWAETVARLIPWWNGGYEVANAADNLYAERILRPLTSRSSTQSPGGQTAGSTSPTQPSGSTLGKPSKRSSRTSSDGPPSVAMVR